MDSRSGPHRLHVRLLHLARRMGCQRPEGHLPLCRLRTGKESREMIDEATAIFLAPRHFADVLNENDDAGTGDVFLQCCLFGEIIFG
jgi:hypothetical protein